jgi:hypothetical protein
MIPFDPAFAAGKGSAFVFAGARQKGAFLGLARRVQRISRADADAAREAHGRINQRMADKLTEVRSRHTSTTRAITERKAHNLKVIEDFEEARRQQTRDAEDALAKSLSSPTTHDHENDTNTDAEPDFRDIFAQG